MENTLSVGIGRFFVRALQNNAPYSAWPAAIRAAVGSSTRTVSATFYYD